VAKKLFHKSTFLTTLTNWKAPNIKKLFLTNELRAFSLLLAFFPANIAKRFVFPNAYIRGILVDYLIPTVYLEEVLVLLLLVLNLFRNMVSLRKLFRALDLVCQTGPLLLFPLSLIPSVLSGGFSIVSLFRVAEIVLWVSFTLYLARNVRCREDRRRVVKMLSLATSWVSLLAIAQFLAQKNIFSYYFLGEPVLYPSLGGVAKTSFLGKEVLRAYGTFPHPNVLGGVMSVVVPWLLAEGFFLSAGLGVVALFVSFSRLAWITFLFGFFAWAMVKFSALRRTAFIFLASITLVLVTLYLFPSIADLSVIRRLELFRSARAMFLSSPLAGVGLGLFTAKLPSFGLPSGPTLFLQPVHNIFALIAAESGVFALLASLFIFILAGYYAFRKRHVLLLTSLFQLVLLGLFDHYLYTLPQGLFLTSLTLGLVFSYSESDGE